MDLWAHKYEFQISWSSIIREVEACMHLILIRYLVVNVA